MSAKSLEEIAKELMNDGYAVYPDILINTSHELAALQARITELDAVYDVAVKLLKEARDLFDGEACLCDEVGTREWEWRWKVKYHFEETDIPFHRTPEDMTGEL